MRNDLQKLIAKRGFVPAEDAEQVKLAQWLDLHKILWCHVPNGGKRGITTARKLKAHGVKAGVPDVLIFDRAPVMIAHGKGCTGVAIELKRIKDGQTSADQKKWLADLTERGWICEVCAGADKAIEFLQSLGYGRSNVPRQNPKSAATPQSP